MKKPIDLGRRDTQCTARWHGTWSAYKHGCRCPHAREVHRIRGKRLRQGRAEPSYIDAVGTARRIQALCRIGYRMSDIGDRLGASYQFVQKLAMRDNPTITRRTAARVAAIYADLAWKPGPSKLARQRAEAKGWVSPAAWDDIDDPNCRPDIGPPKRGNSPKCGDAPVNMTEVGLVVNGEAPFAALHSDAERVLAVGQLLASGHTQTAISRILGIGHNRVRRLAALAGQEQPVAA